MKVFLTLIATELPSAAMRGERARQNTDGLEPQRRLTHRLCRGSAKRQREDEEWDIQAGILTS